MGNDIVILTKTLRVSVQPEDMPDKEFDDYIEQHYSDIEALVDVTDVIKNNLNEVESPLQRFKVIVDLKDH